MNARRLPCIIVLVAISSTTTATEPINPIPRAEHKTILRQWEFERATEGWTAESQCRLAANDGQLVVTTTGSDPYFHCPVDLASGAIEVTLRVRAEHPTGGTGSVFWTTDQAPRRGEDKRADFALESDGKWHETSALFDAPGQLADLRIDPGTVPSVLQIDWIRVSLRTLHPLTIDRVSQTPDQVMFQVRNHAANATAFQCDGKPRQLPAGASMTIARQPDHQRPLSPVTLRIDCDGWPPLTRTVWVVNPAAPVEWIERPLKYGTLQVAPDGSVARIVDRDQVLATLGPLVQMRAGLPRFGRPRIGKSIVFVSDEAELRLTPEADELAIEIDAKQPCTGPVVRVYGALTHGLFAGLEYLGKDERSSSSLDIETPEHVRFAPDPLKVTMPLMAFVTSRASVAMTWRDMGLQPVYATPNFFDGTPDHRMTLRGQTIKATLRIAQDPLEEAILWSVKRHGLPPLPEAGRSIAEQNKLCLTALSGPLATDQGWGHCAQPRWQRRPFADMASTLWRLGGDVPSFPQWVPGGAHVPNGTIYFVTGRARQWLDYQRNYVKQLQQRQRPDGSYRYAGKYRRGHFEDTASGVCAQPAARLLDFAYYTGDPESLAAGTRTLEFMKRFHTPRGAQVWECPLHTPDQLASAYLVWAYVRGYQLTGKVEYLRHARRWALSGLPFTYLWSCYPIMAYATPPVYGATNWQAPNWMGLPVQWVGGVYAYALALLAPYDETLDWSHIARGILVSAQQQQYPDGNHAGLLPDSFNIQHQRRQPADINPCALVSLQRRLDGEPDFLNVASDTKHRVAAPFPVAIRNGAAHITARKGVSYQVLVNGTQIIEVTSRGDDVVHLD